MAAVVRAKVVSTRLEVAAALETVPALRHRRYADEGRGPRLVQHLQQSSGALLSATWADGLALGEAGQKKGSPRAPFFVVAREAPRTGS